MTWIWPPDCLYFLVKKKKLRPKRVCFSSPQTLPLLRSEQQDALGFNADLQQLYAAIVAHGNAGTRKRKLSEERPVEEDQPPTEEPDLTSSLGLESSPPTT